MGDRESAFLKVIQYLDFITVKVDNTSLNKYLVEKQESMFKDITEIAGNFVLIPSQNSYEDFFNETNSSKPNSLFLKNQASNTIRPKDIRI